MVTDVLAEQVIYLAAHPARGTAIHKSEKRWDENEERDGILSIRIAFKTSWITGNYIR